MSTLPAPIPSLVAALLIAYALLAAFALLRAEHMIFQPPAPGYTDDEAGIIKLRTRDGPEISALFLERPGAGHTILYSHGNAEDLGTVRPSLEALRSLGFSVLAYDYRGYGTSDGAPSEAATYRDIDAAYEYLVEDRGIPPERILVHGVSVGGGPAADLAARRPVAGLVLESTFTTAFRVLTRVPLFPFDRYRTLAKIDRVDAPVLVIHGTADAVIPFWHARRLFDAAPEPKRFLRVDGAGHNDLRIVAGDRYGRALRQFARLTREHPGRRRN